VALQTDYRNLIKEVDYGQMIYTGPVDEFFHHRYGKLPYRSLDFRHETHDREVFQENAVINYPNEHLYTRITEFKYLTGQSHSKTSIVYEFPRAEGDPYYPVPMPENQELYKKYKQLADMTENTHFVGRLATYKYYNMDQVTAQALSLFEKLEIRHRLEQVPVARVSLSAGQSQLRDVSPSQVSVRETSKVTGDRVA
jgi:UDP-galactopyranose mutase